MSRRSHRFDLEALTEFEAPACYYAEQQSGLDMRFIASIEDTVTLICETPERWRIVAGSGVRRALARVFPYRILIRSSLTTSSLLLWPTIAASRITAGVDGYDVKWTTEKPLYSND